MRTNQAKSAVIGGRRLRAAPGGALRRNACFTAAALSWVCCDPSPTGGWAARFSHIPRQQESSESQSTTPHECLRVVKPQLWIFGRTNPYPRRLLALLQHKRAES